MNPQILRFADNYLRAKALRIDAAAYRAGWPNRVVQPM
jgi:hypothetical protein